MKLFTEKDVTEMILKTRKFGFTAEYLIISTQGIELPTDDDIEAYISTFPYTKHLDDGQYNDGVIVGAELGIEWYREQLKQRQ